MGCDTPVAMDKGCVIIVIQENHTYVVLHQASCSNESVLVGFSGALVNGLCQEVSGQDASWSGARVFVPGTVKGILRRAAGSRSKSR
jgi:hypothetical protein